MASLNTLRTKGGWFLTIIIALALLAFIATDFGSRNKGQDPVVGTIGGTKIHYTEYNNEIARQEQMVQGSGEQAKEEAMQRAWSELVSRTALQPGFVKMGLTLSADEQKDLLSGTGGGFISPVVQQYFSNPETGAFDNALMSQFVANATGAEYQMWQTIKQQSNDERLFSKYGTLVAGGQFVNDLEVAKGVDGENKLFDARIIFKPYSLIADSTVVVSDGELRAYYNAHKARFERGASRDVEYVVFDIVPSAADRAEAKERADELAAQFAAAENPEQFARTNSDDKTPATFVREDALNASMMVAIAAGEMYGPVLEGDNYTMARLVERRAVPDSVTFSAIILPADNAALADSIAGVATPANFAELATRHSAEPSQEVTLDPALMTPELAAAMIDTPVGGIGRAQSQGAVFLINVTGKSAAATKVKVATVKLAVRAGATTHAEIATKANDFYAKASKSQTDFDKTATEMSLPKRSTRIQNTDRAIEGLENSLGVVRWAFTNKKGAVMEPQTLGRDYIVVPTLTGVSEAGVAPFEEVKSQIRSLLVQRKKGEQLAATLAGSSLDEVARGQSLEVKTTQGLKFSAFMVPEVGFEPRLVGAICSTTEQGKLSKPIKGVLGVYAFEVTGIVTEENIDAAGIRVRLESMNQYMLNNALMNALYKKSNVVDERVKYF